MADDPQKKVRAEVYSLWEKAMDSMFEELDDAMAASNVPEDERQELVKQAIDSDVAYEYNEWVIEGG